jgi:DNA modification methylase
MPQATIRSPKRRRGSKLSRADWFRYYADFSTDFVESAVDYLNLASGATLLDPWLGGGTSAEVAAANNLRFKGYDINPVMLLVSRARIVPTNAVDEISTLLDSIARSFKKKTKSRNLEAAQDEALEQWLQPSSARAFRVLERCVEVNLNGLNGSAIPLWRRTGQVSPVFAFFYVGLFRTLRSFISDFETSNPTWVKISNGKRIHAPPDRILTRFCKEVQLLMESITAEEEEFPLISNRRCVLDRASSLNLPLSPNSVDAIISSPAYCTRIDYVRATLPELAVIGHPNGRVIRKLRERMIGTPTIDDRDDYNADNWGNTCSRFLSAVERHTSKASSTYYLKYYQQYFASIFASLKEIDRVLKTGGHCVLVIQDSYYKNRKNNLPLMFIEMAEYYGWSLDKRKPFRVNQTLAGVNPDVKAYRTTFHATEWALVFSK